MATYDSGNTSTGKLQRITRMKKPETTVPEFSLTLAELRKSWIPWHWTGTILHDKITLTDEDTASLARDFVVSTIDIPMIESPEREYFEAAWGLPNTILEVTLKWRLTWPDRGSFSDPIAFIDADYDNENHVIDDLDWSSDRLPRTALVRAVEWVDWYSVSQSFHEHQKGREPDFSEFPAILQPIMRKCMRAYGTGLSANNEVWLRMADELPALN